MAIVAERRSAESKHRWGVISSGEFLHIVPVDEHEEVIRGHKLSPQCPCQPAMDDNDSRICIHEPIQ